MLDKLTREMFDGLLNRTFRIALGDTALETQLVDCRPLPADPENSRREPFSLVFRGPLESVLPQQVYEVQSEETGSLEIFLVPIGPDKTGMRYEAIFT